ncbi:unnamed protein product [Symbiodinium necroappetens]|uniref:Uncharacterized protein n=1 Tax=Symbiodinium necroappetens TaxID=1628268 RepID=A0A813CAY7_9DINO|nr:unnamed protein product [Symbiodinium necroappetens]
MGALCCKQNPLRFVHCALHMFSWQSCLVEEYTVHYDRTAGAPSMAFSYAGDVACGTCKGERIVRDGPSLLSEGASKPDGLTSLRKLKHLPTTRRLDTFSGSF